jgi:hypothetical protein
MKHVHILEYTHSHGTDLAAFATVEAAFAARFATMREWIGNLREVGLSDDEIEDVSRRIDAHDPKLIEFWAETMGETFEVSSLSVEPSPPSLADHEIEEIKARYGSEDLDDHVHELASQEASSVNNEGVLAQIEYMTERGGADWVRELLDLKKPSHGSES